MFPNSWLAQEALADFAEGERWEAEMQALGVSAADLRAFEAIIERTATRTTLPNHVIVHEGRILGKCLVSSGSPLLPAAATRHSWIAQFIQSLLLRGVLSLSDPLPIAMLIETAKAAIDEHLA